MKVVRWGLAALALATASGCGLKGDLQTPPPLFGEDREKYEAEQRAKAAEAKAKADAEAAQAQQDAAPVPAPAPQAGAPQQ